MSDTDKEFEIKNKSIIDNCIKQLSIKSEAVRNHKATSLDTRRRIEDLKMIATLEDDWINGELA